MMERQPIRLGIVGMSPPGQFLIERMSISTTEKYELIAFSPPGNTTTNWPPQIAVEFVEDWHSFLANPNLSAVLFLDGLSITQPQFTETINTGHAVGIVPPLAWNVQGWSALGELFKARVFFVNLHQEDEDYRTALATVRSGELGEITAIKRISWTAGLVTGATETKDQAARWLQQFLWEDLDQLLELAGELPNRVYASELMESPGRFSLCFRFPSGLIAQLDRRSDSVVPLDLGWTISGSTGGYTNTRRYLQTESGEVYDVPAPPVGGAITLLPLTPLGYDRALHIFAIQQAAYDSARSGEVVPLRSLEDASA